ncbi:hypothetical protein SAMN05660461_1346 [Chitinophaga ginsengisegetis]|uniref:Uncharacterized protein n=1 Tax=Chitinophaga ginsengisegetis TaxID=393003 RepID=A0A1T5NFW6_9BACT|nr:hypothetical protein SAMN05660461_1346 [Chitinophaga ginsengisegetis]
MSFPGMKVCEAVLPLIANGFPGITFQLTDTQGSGLLGKRINFNPCISTRNK